MRTLVSSSSIHGVALLVGLSRTVTGADSAAAPHSCCGRHRAGTGGAARVSGDIVTAILTILTPTIHTERCVQCQNKIDFFIDETLKLVLQVKGGGGVSDADSADMCYVLCRVQPRCHHEQLINTFQHTPTHFNTFQHTSNTSSFQ